MMNMTATSPRKRKGTQLLAPLALAAAFLLPWTGAQALPFTSDIVITGAAAFNGGQALAVDVNQSGSYSVTQGGVTTTNTVNGTTVTGSDPLAAALTQTGDGFGISASASSTTSGAEGEFPMDVGFSIANNSISSVYKVKLQLAYDHSVDADGTDAFAISEYSLFDVTNNLELLFRGVTSDTVFEDQKNDAFLGTFGDLVADSGNLLLDLVINPGELLDLALQYDLSSGNFSDPGAFAARLSGFLSIASVEHVEGGTVPVPATLYLLLAGVMGMMASRRRS